MTARVKKDKLLNDPQDSGANFVKTSIDWGLALAIPPFLGALRLAETLGVELQTLGEWSEELFRGQRLPVLPFPDTDPPP